MKGNIKKLTITVIIAAIAMFTAVSATAGDLQSYWQGPSWPLTLGQLPPPWSQKLPGFQRFVVVLDGEGVLDKETGLVWQRFPWGAPPTWTWKGALLECNVAMIGGRLGWHLPTVEQLTSLIDNNSPETIKLPPGHPFGVGGVLKDNWYWTASPWMWAKDHAITVNFAEIYPENISPRWVGDGDLLLWCVRGGQFYVGWEMNVP